MSALKPVVGVVALGRPTFDVPYAEEILSKAWKALQSLPIELVGEPKLLFDADAVIAALPGLKAQPLDMLLLLQVTFTDATMTVEIGKQIDAPLVMWSFPEERTGGRLPSTPSVASISRATRSAAMTSLLTMSMPHRTAKPPKTS